MYEILIPDGLAYAVSLPPPRDAGPMSGQLLAGKRHLPVIDLDIVPEVIHQPRDTLLDQVTTIHATFLPP